MDLDLSPLWGDAAVRAMTAAAVAAGVVLIGLFVRRSVVGRIEDVDVRYRTRKAVTTITWLLALAFAFAEYSDALSGMGAAIGVAGAGIAFALQEVIASAAGWLAIQFGGFFRPGDRVQLGGIRGDVIDVGLLRTTLMEVGAWVDGDLYNGRVVRVANSFVFKEPVYNYSAGFPFLWDEVVVPVRYGSDADFARSTLLAIAEEVSDALSADAAHGWHGLVRDYRLEDARLDPMVTLALTDNWMAFTVRYITHFQRRRVTKDALFQRILTAFEAAPDRLAFASATFELVKSGPLAVTVSESSEKPTA